MFSSVVDQYKHLTTADQNKLKSYIKAQSDKEAEKERNRNVIVFQVVRPNFSAGAGHEKEIYQLTVAAFEELTSDEYLAKRKAENHGHAAFEVVLQFSGGDYMTMYGINERKYLKLALEYLPKLQAKGIRITCLAINWMPGRDELSTCLDLNELEPIESVRTVTVNELPIDVVLASKFPNLSTFNYNFGGGFRSIRGSDLAIQYELSSRLLAKNFSAPLPELRTLSISSHYAVKLAHLEKLQYATDSFDLLEYAKVNKIRNLNLTV